MDIIKFIKSIYLGDRYCKKLIIDCEEETISIQVDNISRIRNINGNWDYYTDEDIKNGFLVFNEIESIKFTPAGNIPNDLINSFEYKDFSDVDNNSKNLFIFSIDSVNREGEHTEVTIEIIAKDFHIEHPGQSSIKIIS